MTFFNLMRAGLFALLLGGLAACQSAPKGLTEQQIAALKEYKTSLINAAVTGKIKVA